MNRHDTDYVRFARGSTPPLHRLPSHANRRGPVHAPLLPPMRRPIRVLVRLALAGLVVLLALAALAASGLLAAPAERLASETLQRMVPPGHRLRLGRTDVRLAWPPSLAVTYDDVALNRTGEPGPAVSARRLSVRVDPFSLLAGTPRIAGIAVDGARLNIAALAGATDPQAPLGLSAVPERFDRMFTGLRRWGAVHLHRSEGLALDVSDSALLLGDTPLGAQIGIARLAARADGSGTATLAGELAFDGDPTGFTGTIAVPAGSASAPARIVAELDAMPFPWRRLPTIFSDDMADHEPDAERPAVPTRTRLVMIDGGAGSDRLRLTLTPADLTLKLAEGDRVPVSGRMAFSYVFEDRTVTLEPAAWSIGRSRFELSARFRDRPGSDPSAPGVAPVQFELIADRGRLAPADSPVRPLRFAARAQGSIEAGERLVRFTDIDLRSVAGRARAEGQVSFDPAAPTAVFHADVADMATSGLKQLWPAPVARAARRWVLANLAGGRVVEGRFDIVEPLRRRDPGTGRRIVGDTRIALDMAGVRFDTAGDLPPVRDAAGRVEFADGVTRATLDAGTVFLPSGRSAQAAEGVMLIRPEDETGLVFTDINVRVTGSAAAIGEIIAYRPIEADRYRDYDPDDLSGEVDARIALTATLNEPDRAPPPEWSVDLALTDAAIAEPVEGRLLAGLDGTMQATPAGARLDLTGTIDAMPATIVMTIPFPGSDLPADRNIALRLDDESRAEFAPALADLLRGPTPVTLDEADAGFAVTADLSAAELRLPWIGWSKGAGVDARAAFDLLTGEGGTVLADFELGGETFGASGRIELGEGGLRSARFGRLRLNDGDAVAVDISRDGSGYSVDVRGEALDVRALVRHVRRRMQADGAAGGDGNVPVRVSARLDSVRGFRGEVFRNVRADLSIGAAGLESLSVTATGASGMPLSAVIEGRGAGRRIRLEAFDAGEFLRFADLYGQMRGGVLTADLAGGAGGRLAGPVRVVDFRIFDEPKLAQLVSTDPQGAGSLSQAVRRDIDTREVVFDVAQGTIVASDEGLALQEGIVRGPLVGFALQGLVADGAGRMRLTGTFMPAYGLNSLFAEIPIVGLILGNGTDRGLIGVTFRLEGAFDEPQITVNPLSVIAPGVFRSIFEFR